MNKDSERVPRSSPDGWDGRVTTSLEFATQVAERAGRAEGLSLAGLTSVSRRSSTDPLDVNCRDDPVLVELCGIS
jgi:hypothetical protein